MRMLRGMADGKNSKPAGRAVRESEIFREPPGSGSYSSSIGAAQGIEQFARARPDAASPPRQNHF